MIIFALAFLALLLLWLLTDMLGRKPEPPDVIAVGDAATHPLPDLDVKPWVHPHGTRMGDYEDGGHLNMVQDVNWDGRQ